MTGTATTRDTAERGAPGGKLAPLAQRAIGWLALVRDGQLDPARRARTLRQVYWTWLLALLLKAGGSAWDVAWHFRWQRDNFAPPHDLNLIGDAIVVVLVLFHLYTRFGVDETALRLMTGGITLFLGSAPLDVINHAVFGLDITSWSLTHFGLYVGTAIMIAGAIRGWRRASPQLPALASHGGALRRLGVRVVGIWGERTLLLGLLWFFFVENVFFPNQHQEYGVMELASWDRSPGHPFAEPSLLEFAARQIGRPVDRVALAHFALPIPSWVYPFWITAAVMLALVVARRSLGLRWSATSVALAYVLWRTFMLWLLSATNFPTSAVPLLILGGAVAIDVVTHLGLDPLVEAGLGAIAVTGATYGLAAAQLSMFVAPPIGYGAWPAAAVILGIGWYAVASGAPGASRALAQAGRLIPRPRSG